ncbi:hypothetical protein DTO212C5_1060 [Paecilomyces variotii]|nr:hypothetical protein DTO212C5_1060 [Paecilomyces variotii]
MSATISNYLVLSLSCSFQSEIRNGRRVTEPRPVEVAVQIATYLYPEVWLILRLKSDKFSPSPPAISLKPQISRRSLTISPSVLFGVV